MTITANEIGAVVQPTMYGLFFEDINYGADGGLYAELVKNRSFEFPQNLMGWESYGNVELKDDGPFERNPHYVRLTHSGHGHKHTGLQNEGFFGIGVKQGAEYRFSVWARGEKQRMSVQIVKPNSMNEDQFIAAADIDIDSKEWKKYTITLRAAYTEPKAKLRIFLRSAGALDLEHISLFPVDTWQGRENGLRKDLVQALYDIKPGVFRFPGGCVVEGTDVETRYYWKNTVGAVENRPLNENRWHYTFQHRFFPDYYQSYGLGFYEYFQLAEDIGAEPLPVLNCGLVCQFQNGLQDQVAVSEIDEYIQDAIDLVEFANGDTTTTWGKLRAEMGHPEPFNLKFLAVGNEQWGNEYVERLAKFVDVLREKCPEIKIIGGSGPLPDGEWYDHLWGEMKNLKVDLVDEHFYRDEQWFLNSGMRYDSYDREGPKVFAGEYACHGANGKKWNHFNAALMEAAFMTNLERNADIVHMATYAPLFAHIEGWQWRPDMIWFDNLRSVRTCSYYVQQLYGRNKGTNVVPLEMDGKPVAGVEGQDGLFASAVWDAEAEEYIVKVINTSDKEQAVTLFFDGLSRKESLGEGSCTTLHADNLTAENTLDEPNAIVPVESRVVMNGYELNTQIKAKTFALYRIPRLKR